MDAIIDIIKIIVVKILIIPFSVLIRLPDLLQFIIFWVWVIYIVIYIGFEKRFFDKHTVFGIVAMFYALMFYGVRLEILELSGEIRIGLIFPILIGFIIGRYEFPRQDTYELNRCIEYYRRQEGKINELEIKLEKYEKENKEEGDD